MAPPADDHDPTAARLNQLLQELERQTAAAADLQELVTRGLAETHTHHALDDAALGAPGSAEGGEPDPDEGG